jgi:hypothetical protein
MTSSQRGPLAGTVSWLRGYAMPTCIRTLRETAGGAGDGNLSDTDVRRILTDGQIQAGDYAFWDVQALRRCHVLRVISAGAIECRPSTSADWIPVKTHLVLHEAGLALIRLTLDPFSEGKLEAIPDLDSYSDAVWNGEHMQWRVTLAERPIILDTDVRHAMDMVMLPIHERCCGRTPDIAAFERLTTFDARYEWLEARVSAGESLSAYPVTFGTAYELVWGDRRDAEHSLESVAELAYGVKRPSNDGAFLQPAESGCDHDWFIGENRAVLALSGATLAKRLDTFDALRIQILEYLTLQRAALRAVQRGTQLVITERDTISHAQLQEWQRLVASLTDEYVLHDQVARVLGPVRCHMRDHPRVRDPATLEAQVRQNLATFQGLITAARGRVAIVLSGLFGVVAALTLAPLARELELTLFATRGTAARYESLHPILSIVIDLILLVIVGSVSAIIIARANRLRGVKR